MRSRIQALIAMSALTLSSMHLAEVAGEAPEPPGSLQVAAPGTVTARAGLLGWSGGAVKGKQVVTQTSTSNIDETATWVNLPDARLSRAVADDETDLFSVSFTTESHLVNGGTDDAALIRVIDLLTGLPLEPNDGSQALFHAAGWATYKGNWVRRMDAGTHVLQVQFFLSDGAPLETLVALIDDWTFELVVYD